MRRRRKLRLIMNLNLWLSENVQEKARKKTGCFFKTLHREITLKIGMFQIYRLTNQFKTSMQKIC